MIYLDNAATSWPKPPGVAKAMIHFLEKVGANPGRSGHRQSVEAGRVVYAARESVAQLFNVQDPLRVAFGSSVTEALNLVIRGYLRPGDHVVTSSIEHNSVMRPLRALASDQGKGHIELTVVPCTPAGFLDPVDLEKALRPRTALVILNHASNVCGSILPIRQAGEIARRHGCMLAVDVAQTAGAYPIDMQQDRIDLLAFTGHKAMGGPMGTGGLIVGNRVDLERLAPLMRGGTGSSSEREEQPDFLPDKYESGTANAVGLAGLAAGLSWVLDQTVEAIRQKEMLLTRRLIDGLQGIPRVTVHGGLDATKQAATVSFTVGGLEPSEVGLWLDERYDVMCRVGLHCAPAAHKTLGTFPSGSVRFGLSAFNTSEEVDTALGALEELVCARR